MGWACGPVPRENRRGRTLRSLSGGREGWRQGRGGRGDREEERKERCHVGARVSTQTGHRPCWPAMSKRGERRKSNNRPARYLFLPSLLPFRPPSPPLTSCKDYHSRREQFSSRLPLWIIRLLVQAALPSSLTSPTWAAHGGGKKQWLDRWSGCGRRLPSLMRLE